MTARSATRDETFPHRWQAEILQTPPLIAPARHFIYPQAVEEVEQGALQILLRARPDAEQQMMTFALGFADAALPHGLWGCPNPAQLCAIAGGYAYLVDAEDPRQWSQIPYRPVLSVHPVLESGLLIVSSFHQLWALGANGPAWETARLSWEGLRVTEISGGTLHGFGWDLGTDAEVAFSVDLATGQHTGGAGPERASSPT